MTDYPIGIDLSRYQYSADGKQKPNFDVINAKCAFVGVRAGISWGYTDPWFSYTWQHLTVPRMAYHVIYPGEDARRQTDHFLSIVKPGEHDRLVLDMELDHGYSKARITDTLLECLEYLKGITGRYPIIYSRASWINQFLDVSRLPKLDWWLAGYRYPLPYPLYTPEATPPPALPKGVKKWLIHQTCEKGNGAEYGVASYYVDLDRWNGTSDDILTYFGLTGQPEPEPLTSSEEEKTLFEIEVICDALNVRSGPGINYSWRDITYKGDVHEVYEEKNNWYRIGNELWVSGYPAYVRKLVPPDPNFEERIASLEARMNSLETRVEELEQQHVK